MSKEVCESDIAAPALAFMITFQRNEKLWTTNRLMNGSVWSKYNVPDVKNYGQYRWIYF